MFLRPRLFGAVALGLFLAAGARARERGHLPPQAPQATDSPASTLARLACTSCHLPAEPRTPAIFTSFDSFQKTHLDPATCAGCHVNNGLAVAEKTLAYFLPFSDGAVARIRHMHAYRSVPDLSAPLAIGGSVAPVFSLQRFSECGLRAFLASPVPRRLRATEAMFPVARERVDEIVRAGGLAPCEDGEPVGDGRRGQELFVAKGCAGCHGVRPEAPLLRLGAPLLSRWYFSARVRGGSGVAGSSVYAKRWATEGVELASLSDPAAVPMPAFPELTDAEIDDLYRYIGADASDRLPRAKVAEALPRDDIWSKSVGEAMFRAVQHQVFDTSCRHCHDARPEAGAVLKNVFGASTDVEFPLSRFPTPEPTAALRAVLSPGAGCSDSRLVGRLRAREGEWAGVSLGDAAQAPLRGMPMTLPPLPEETIRLVEAWSRHGCPSDRGELCDACVAR